MGSACWTSARTAALMDAMPELPRSAPARKLHRVGMSVAGINEAGLLAAHDAVQRVEVFEAIDRRLVQGRNQGFALAEVVHDCLLSKDTRRPGCVSCRVGAAQELQ